MLKLTLLPNQFRKDFVNERKLRFHTIRVRKDFTSKVNGTLANALMAHLLSRLDLILGGTPGQLRKEIRTINAHPVLGAFARYCEQPDKNPAMEVLVDLVKRLFNYEHLRDDEGAYGAYALVQQHGQRICPYCHMHHVNFHIRAGSRLKMRPPLDHYYPRSVYPYLGTSLYNLVPSCEQCNSRVKLACDPFRRKIPHPFDQKSKILFRSGWQPGTALAHIKSTANFSFDFDGLGRDAKSFAQFFMLNERYGWYGRELLDMVQRRNALMDLAPGLIKVVDSAEYIAGFPAAEVSERALGLFLLDAAKRMK